MANVQLQRTVNAETFTKTAIDQKQSLEVVQTLLHAGLSSLAYLRNFFDKRVFDEQFYEMSENIPSYEDYSEGRLAKHVWEATDPKTKMRTMRRARSKRADMLLNWLEQGAFVALKDGTLEALNIYVHPDPQDRKKVIEQYTFTVKYLPGPGGGEILAGLELDGDNIPHVSIGAANAGLQKLLQTMMKLCNPLPNLPEQRFVSMEIFYKQGSKPAELNGWVPSISDSMFFAESDDWEKRVERPQEAQSGFHGTSFKLASLQPISQGIEATFDDFIPPDFPASLQYHKRSSKRRELRTNESEGGVSKFPSEEGNATPSQANWNTPSTIIESASRQTLPTQSQAETGRKWEPIDRAPTPSPLHRKLNHTSKVDSVSRALSHPSKQALLHVSQSAESLNTQSSNIPEMTNRFRAMLQSENFTQGDTQTQEPLHRPNAPRHRSLGQLHTETAFKQSAEATQPTKNKGPTLAQHTIERLEQNKQQLRSTALRLAKAEGSKRKDGELVLCQCGCSEDEGAMVCCGYCKTWQHLHCYGYTGVGDPRLPQNHVCYQCLLGDREEGTLNMMGDLVQKRRGMHFAIENGLRTQRDFAKDMGLPSSVAGPLYQHLKKEGYVKDAKGSRKAGYAASGKPILVAVQDGANHEKMLRKLFDPILYIGHHFEIRLRPTASTPSPTQQFVGIRKNNMAPPATPALKQKNNARTPGSGFDLRASMTPLYTSGHLHSHQVQPSKRHRPDDDDKEPPPKRHVRDSSFKKRVESVKTSFIVDMRGMSPAPFWINGSDYIQQSSEASGPGSDV